ncbi:MAG: hypothetical protein D6770_03815 [Anaerolineae bacterium]|nr:MAG: hypothetical protein D6770_03815 [Anaerolineae bacterium]
MNVSVGVRVTVGVNVGEGVSVGVNVIVGVGVSVAKRAMEGLFGPVNQTTRTMIPTTTSKTASAPAMSGPRCWRLR